MAKKSTSSNILRFWRLSCRERRIILVLAAAFIIGCVLPGRIIVATSDSLDHRIFFRVPVSDTIGVGDYLLFRLHRHDEYAKHLRKGIKYNDVLIKKVGCIPGNVLTRDREGVFFCDATRIANAMVHDSQGSVLPVFNFTGVIPHERYFMMGTNPRSFDSRYFGFIHADDFISKALPLW